MTRRRPGRGARLVAAVFALGACGDDGAAPPTTDAAPATADAASAATDAASADLAGTSWTLASAVVEDDDVAAVGAATLDFGTDGSTLTGSTGCNQFSGTYTQSAGSLTIALGPVTRAACGDPAATAQEDAVLTLLPEVAAFTADGPLVLLDDGRAPLLTYEAGLAGLAGTTWTATGVNNGRGAVESTAATESVTAEFGADGALAGFAGCNTYTASYEVTDDDGISITAVATTRMACADEAMTLEEQYLAAIQAASTYTISGDTLTLRDADGSMQATYARAP